MQKLKRIVATTLFTAFAAIGATAQSDSQTSDVVNIKEGVTLTPGSNATQYLTVTLAGATDKYVGYQMDIILPEGVEMAYYEGAADVFINDTYLYPTGGRPSAPYHSISCNVNDSRVAIMCVDVSGNRAFTTNASGKTADGALFDFGVVASPYLKPGTVNIELRGVKLSNIKATGTVKESVITSTVEASNNSTLNIKVSASNKFSTAILPFDVEQIPAGLEVYSCNSTDGEYLVLTKQESIKAFTPYILYSKNGYEGTLSGTVDANKYTPTVTDGFITGTVVKQEITGGNGYYVMQNKGDGAMFYKVGDTPFTIPAGKCWLTLPQEMQEAAMFRLGINTGIDEVTATGTPATVYDLYGRRVQDVTRPGIYIVDGKKRVIK